MANKKYCVYEHLFPNGKRYIGITCKRPNARWENGNGYAAGSPVRNAVEKYGWDNIEHNILFTGLTAEEAQNKEIELIAYYKTNIHRYGDLYGYNMTDGGEGTVGHRVSQETVEKMSMMKLGKKGKDCPNSRAVICDGIEYESLTDFKIKNGNPKGNISGWLLGNVGMPEYWYDKRLHYKDTDFSIIKKSKVSKNRYRKVMIDGLVFDTLGQCGEYLNICGSAISLYLTDKLSVPEDMVNRNLKYEDEDFHVFKKVRKDNTQE